MSKKTASAARRNARKPSFTVRAVAEDLVRERLLAEQDVAGIARNLDRFPDVDARALALTLLRAGKGFEIVFNFPAFERRGLSRAALRRLVRRYEWSPAFWWRAVRFGFTGKDNPLEGFDEVDRFLREETGD